MELIKLSLSHVKEIADKLDNDCISLGINLEKEEFNARKHTYPIAGDVRDISRWVEAIFEAYESEED